MDPGGALLAMTVKKAERLSSIGRTAADATSETHVQGLRRIIPAPIRGALKPIVVGLIRVVEHRTVRRRQRRRVAALLSRYSERLAPGAWDQVGRIALLRGSDLPVHIRRTVLERELDGRIIYKGAHRVAQGATSGATILIDGGMPILFVPGSGEFLRFVDEPIFDDYYREQRERFASVIPSPSFSTENDGLTLIEASLDGVPLSEVAPDEGHRLVAELFDRLQVLARTYAAPMPEAAVAAHADALDLLLAHLERDALTDAVDLVLLRQLLTGSQGVPAKGRAIGQNNLIVADGVLHCIDFPRVSLRPFWSDAVILVLHTEAAAFRAGDYDTRIQHLLAEGGITMSAPMAPAERAAVVVATLLCERLPVDKDSLADGVTTAWIPIAAEAALRDLRKGWPELLDPSGETL